MTVKPFRRKVKQAQKMLRNKYGVRVYPRVTNSQETFLKTVQRWFPGENLLHYDTGYALVEKRKKGRDRAVVFVWESKSTMTLWHELGHVMVSRFGYSGGSTMSDFMAVFLQFDYLKLKQPRAYEKIRTKTPWKFKEEFPTHGDHLTTLALLLIDFFPNSKERAKVVKELLQSKARNARQIGEFIWKKSYELHPENYE